MAFDTASQNESELEPSFNRYPVVSGNYRRPNLGAGGAVGMPVKLLIGAAVLTALPFIADMLW